MNRSGEREAGAETDHPGVETEESGSDGRLSGVRRRAGLLFSPRSFLLSLLAVVAGIAAGGFLGGLVPFLGTVGQLLGVVVGTFVLGLVRARRGYLEVAAAGAAAATLVVLSSTLGGAFLPVGVEVLQQYGLALASIGAGSGAAAALLGYYFGRDLRAGLTTSL